MMEVNRVYPCHTTNYKRGRTQAVSFVVVHYVGAEGSAGANAKYFSTTPNIKKSAHYFVDHAPLAEVFASVPEEDTAWAVGASSYKHPKCRNANSISVEMCCHYDDETELWYIDKQTEKVAADLVHDIAARHSISQENILRHYDVTGKMCPQPYVLDPSLWEAFKADVAGKYDWRREFEEAWAEIRACGIMDGTRPTDYVTRRELAVILRRLNLY